MGAVDTLAWRHNPENVRKPDNRDQSEVNNSKYVDDTILFTGTILGRQSGGI